MKYSIKGLDKLLTQLADMSNALVFHEVAVKALNEGSDVVADITRKELEALKVDNRPYVNGVRESITELQKRALLRSFGLTPIQEERNRMNRKTGVDKSVNKLGQPSVVIARRLESGTSYMKKNPVFSRASRKARKECIQKMQNSLNESIDKLWNK